MYELRDKDGNILETVEPVRWKWELYFENDAVKQFSSDYQFKRFVDVDKTGAEAMVITNGVTRYVLHLEPDTTPLYFYRNTVCPTKGTHERIFCFGIERQKPNRVEKCVYGIMPDDSLKFIEGDPSLVGIVLSVTK